MWQAWHAFMGGLFSSDAAHPLQVDAAGLRGLATDQLAEVFQVGASNPLVGLEGRVLLLRRLGETLAAQPEVFGSEGRPGGLFDLLVGPQGTVAAHEILSQVLMSLSGIWLADNAIGAQPLGDCWRHEAVSGAGLTQGWMPFHKLSQWLSYSLLEPFQWAGVHVEGLDALTGLPEYRNGGLLLDAGVLRLRRPGVDRAHLDGRRRTGGRMARPDGGAAGRTSPTGARIAWRGRRTDAAGLRAGGRHLGRGPCAGTALA